MSDVEIPTEAAAEEEAPLTEWELNIEVSMSEASSIPSHEGTALCGLIIATSRLVSLPWRGYVLLSFKVTTGHGLLPPGREGKKKLKICDVDLDCLAKVFG